MNYKRSNSRLLIIYLILDLVYLIRLREFLGLVKNHEKVLFSGNIYINHILKSQIARIFYKRVPFRL